MEEEWPRRQPYTRINLEGAKSSIHGGPSGGRNLSQYLAEFGIQADDFEGKRVLDLGAGIELKFARELKEQGIQTQHTISVSPAFEKEYSRLVAIGANRSLDHTKDQAAGTTVAAMGQLLPFEDSSFDRIVSCYAVNWLDNRKQLIIFLREAARVLAPKGIAYFTPFVRDEGSLPEHRLSFRITNIKRLEKVVGNDVKLAWHPCPAIGVPGKSQSGYFLVMEKLDDKTTKT